MMMLLMVMLMLLMVRLLLVVDADAIAGAAYDLGVPHHIGPYSPRKPSKTHVSTNPRYNFTQVTQVVYKYADLFMINS